VSKTFREYYDDDDFGKDRSKKNHKQKRKNLKEYLRHVDDEDFDEEDEKLLG